MWHELFLTNVYIYFISINHIGRMNFIRKLIKWFKDKRVFSRIAYYYKRFIYRPFWLYLKWPVEVFDLHYRIRTRKQREAWFDFKYAIWKFMYDTIVFFENTPDTIPIFFEKWYYRIKKFFLRFKLVRDVVAIIKRFLKVYFFFINFRRLLTASILLDFFHYRYTDDPINPDLRMWYLAWIGIFFQVLLMLMDGADKLLTYNAHDRITRFYIRRYLPDQKIQKRVTEEQQKDKFLKRYLLIRYRRNAILAIFGFYYYARPFMRSPVGRNYTSHDFLIYDFWSSLFFNIRVFFRF